MYEEFTLRVRLPETCDICSSGTETAGVTEKTSHSMYFAKYTCGASVKRTITKAGEDKGKYVEKECPLI